jgi:hypothetical protein
MGFVERIRFPIVLICDGVDLEAFRTVRGVETAVESPDVDDCEVFDATGRRLRLISLADPPERVGPRWLGITAVDVGPVRVWVAEPHPGDGPERLRRRLLDVFVLEGRIFPEAAERLTLDEALGVVRAYYMHPGR